MSLPNETPPIARQGGWFVLFFVVWAAAVLCGYALWRTEDLQPMLAAILSRVVDIAAPIALVVLYLPAGSWLLRKLVRSPLDATGYLLASTALGLGVAIHVAILCGVCQALHVLPLALVPCVLCGCFQREWRDLFVNARKVWRELRASARTWPVALTLGVLGVSLVMALAPEVSQDALHYHLAVPAAWLDAGGFCEVPGNVYARFPMHLEMLFLSGLAVRGEISAKLFHWLFAVGCCWVLRRITSRTCGSGAANWAALLFISIPTVFRVASWAYVDLGLVFFLLLAWDALLENRQFAAHRYWLPGFLVGMACGIKYTALPIAALFAIVCVCQAPLGRRLQSACEFVSIALLAGGFWYVRNLVELGNPVFPFLYDYLGGAGWDAERAAAYATSLREWGQLDWALPLRVTFDAIFWSVGRFDGIVGPAFLLGLPLAILAIVQRPQARLTGFIALALGISWIATTRQIRFLLPALAFFSVLIPIGWECLGAGTARRAASRFAGIAVLFALSSHVVLFCRDAPLAHAVGLESADSVRARLLPGGDFGLFQRLEQVVPEDGRILFGACGNPVFLCKRDYHADSVVENYTVKMMLAAGGTTAGLRDEFTTRGFTHLLFHWPLVFGESGVQSDLTRAQQQLLSEFLNRHATMTDRAGETVLYRLNVGRAPP
ncbi:MAG: ArnT family glycosyltransferase [Planctomycetota bacterium]